jgi:hypothetical protein
MGLRRGYESSGTCHATCMAVAVYVSLCVCVSQVGGLVGLAHVSQLADGPVRDIAAAFKPKQSVRCVVSGVDLGAKKLSLSLKPSVVAEAEEAEEAKAAAGRGTCGARGARLCVACGLGGGCPGSGMRGEQLLLLECAVCGVVFAGAKRKRRGDDIEDEIAAAVDDEEDEDAGDEVRRASLAKVLLGSSWRPRSCGCRTGGIWVGEPSVR